MQRGPQQLQQMQNRASTAVAGAVSTVRESIVNKGVVVIFVLVTLLLIIGIIVWMVYRMKRTDLQGTTLLKAPRALYDMNGGAITIENTKLPVTSGNGQEFTYSFWLYLVDFTTTIAHKPLITRGAGGSTVNDAGTLVYLDNRTNKMFISLKTNLSTTPVATFAQVLDNASSKYITATVEYVPLQRWVNVAFVVKDNLLTVYLDGDMYTIENVHDFYTTTGHRPVFGTMVGDVKIGQLTDTSETRGFISKVMYFNYGLMQSEIRSNYNAGPTTTNVMSRLGFPEYGVRTPVYRLD